jgi:hypothetical protein
MLALGSLAGWVRDCPSSEISPEFHYDSVADMDETRNAYTFWIRNTERKRAYNFRD